MISKIQIGNFKAFGPTQTIPLRPITLVFGPNSAGKSSIIQSLLLACQINDERSADAHKTTLGGSAVDLGGFNQYAHKLQRVISPPTLRFDFDRSDMFMMAEDPINLANDYHPYHATDFETAGIAYTIDRTEEGEVAITSVALFIDGAELLRLFRRKNGIFSMRRDRMADIIPALLKYARSCHIQDSPCLLEELGRDEFELRGLNLRTRFPLTSPVSGYAPDTFLSKSFSENLKKQSEENQSPYPESKKHALDLISKKPRWRLPGLLDDIAAEDNSQNFDQTKKHSNSDDLSELACAQAVRFKLQWFLRILSQSVHKSLSFVSYLGPLREIPPRYTVPGHQCEAAGGGDAWEYLKSNPKTLIKVNRILREKLGLRHELDVRILTPELDDAAIARAAHAGSTKAQSGLLETTGIAEALRTELRLQAGGDVLTQIRLMDKELGLDLSLRDVGMGVSQLLPVVVQAMASQDQLIAIEQPELHLHPALQADLADIFIESALREKNRNMFLIETHSEHLILRIMRRIRESNASRQPATLPQLKPEDIAILYVQPTPNGSVVKHLRLDERGRLIDPWPGGFFEESFNELF